MARPADGITFGKLFAIKKSNMQRIAPIQLLYILLFLPLTLFFRESFLPLLLPLLALPLFWLIQHHWPLPRTPFNGPLLVIFLAILVSLWATPDMEASLRKVIALLYNLLLFFTVVAFSIAQRKHLWVATTMMLLLASGLVVVGFLATLPFATARLPQLQSLSPNPNELAGVITYCLFLLLPIAFVLLFAPPQRYTIFARLLGLIMLVECGIFTFVFYTTRSRGGWLGGVLAIGLLIILALKKPFNYLVMIGGAVGSVIAGWWLFTNEALAGEAAAGAITLSGRVEIWSRAIYGLQDFPFTGMGMNMFREIVHLLYPLFTISPTTDLGHAHNQLLQAGVDLGIPAMIAFLSIWIASAFLLWQGWTRTNDRYLRTLIAGLSATLLAHFIFGIVDAIALGARPNFLLWMLFGLVVAVHHHAVLDNHPIEEIKRADISSAHNLVQAP